MAKSADAFRTIAEVAEWLDTPAHVLRFWESKFNQIRPVKRAGGRRYYRPEDMALLGGIKTLLHEEGLSVKGAQKLLRERGVKYVAGLSPPIDGSPPILDVSPPVSDAKSETAQPAPVVAPPKPRELPAFRPFGSAGRAEPVAPAVSPVAPPADPPLSRPTPDGTGNGLPSFLTGKSGIGAAQHRPDPPISAPPEEKVEPEAPPAVETESSEIETGAPVPDEAHDAAPMEAEGVLSEAYEPVPDNVSDLPAIQIDHFAPPPVIALPPIPIPPEAADLMTRADNMPAGEPETAASEPPPPSRAAMTRQGPGLLALLAHRDRLATAPKKLTPILERLTALSERLAHDPAAPPR